MWASIVKQSAAPSASGSAQLTSSEGLKIVVVDANTIINGIRLEGIADKAVTLQDVLDEVRDKQSRQFLASLAIKLEVSEPSEESLKAVTHFARETGDIHALSSVDLKLLALAHTLEVSAHGLGHLKQHPAQPVLRTRHRAAGRALPGWGRVANPEEWKVVDDANDDDAAAAAAAAGSRIAAHVQQLHLDGAAPGGAVGLLADGLPSAAPPPAAAGAGGGAGATAGQAAPGIGQQGPEQQAQQQREQQQQQQQQQQQAMEESSSDDEAQAGGGDDGWEVAAKSHGAQRRKKRKEYRRQQRQAEFEAEWDEHSRLMQQRRGEAGAAADGARAAVAQGEAEEGQREPQQLFGPAGVYAEGEEGEEDEDEEEGEEDGDEAGGLGTAEEGMEEEHEGDAEAGGSGGDSGDEGPEEEAGQEDLLETSGAWEAGAASSGGGGGGGGASSVGVMTADFAMQNVLLQMGLRLLSRDGRVVSRLSRWALRCSACFFVTREAGRLFCPKCGNMSLDRVEVAVGPDGAEYFGVRKRHILRGTKFSLPKPRGGRNSKDPILREDVFLLKVKAFGRRAQKKQPPPSAEDADLFAPEGTEFGEGRSQAQLAQHRGLARVLEPAWKHNPNERKLSRSNRRR